jgi:nitrogen fixation protein FixH
MKFRELDKSVQRAFYAIGVTFFSLFVATGITIYLANQGHEPVLDPNYYEKGLNYEKTLEDNLKMKEEGFSIDSDIFEKVYPWTRGKNQIQVRFSQNGKPVSGARLILKIERGATFQFNQEIQLSWNQDSEAYEGDLSIEDFGLWVATIQAYHNERNFKRTTKIIVQR